MTNETTRPSPKATAPAETAAAETRMGGTDAPSSTKPSPSAAAAAAEAAAGDWKSMGASDSTLVLGPPKPDGPSQAEIESAHWTIAPSIRDITGSTAPATELGIAKE